MGYADRRVVAWTPYGRERTVSILYRYMLREHLRGIVDEWWLYVNVDNHGQEADVAYAQELTRTHQSWIKLKHRTRRSTKYVYRHKQQYTQFAYEHMTDPDTVYLRFDDDEVYVAPHAIERLVEQKSIRPGTLCLFSLNMNNAIVSYFMQQMGALPIGTLSGSGVTWPRVQAPYCMDAVGWADPVFAELLHCHVLDRLEADKPEDLEIYQDITLAPRQQFSVSCFALDGRDLCALDPPGHVDGEEESWLTVDRPTMTGQVNQILSTAVTVHFSFYPQRDHLLSLNILDRYRTLADRL